MWKIFLGFVVFAAAGLFLIFKGGDKVDMSGEKHDTGSAHVEAAPAQPASASAPAIAPAPTPVAAPAPAPASAASASK